MLFVVLTDREAGDVNSRVKQVRWQRTTDHAIKAQSLLLIQNDKEESVEYGSALYSGYTAIPAWIRLY